VRDRLFSGADVEEALAAAAASLGLPIAQLRYVVLDPGSAGSRGLAATPARIAVMVQEGGLRPRSRETDRRASGGEPRPTAPRRADSRSGEQAPRPSDVNAAIRALVRAVAEAGGLDISCAIEDQDEARIVEISGADAAFFHGEDGRGEELRALEHLLQRTVGAALHPRLLRVRCAGFAERRERALADTARALAAAVRADGTPRTLEPMNSFERRLVHVALQGEPGVTSYSVGEGAERRVTIAPSASGAAPAADPPSAAESGGERDGR
jgi:spoIIIJ-associated protein